MSRSPFRFRYDKNVPEGSPPNFGLVSDQTQTFQAHKLPKFVIPTTPSAPISQRNLNVSRGAARSAEAHVTPKFSFKAAQPLSGRLQNRQFLLPQSTAGSSKRQREAVDEIDAAQDFNSYAHNPFDVSEDLEDPPAAMMTPQRSGHPRFSSTKATLGDTLGSSCRSARVTSVALSRVNLTEMERDSQGSGLLKVPADWSPHKKRNTKMSERSKFLHGGMAETVALWVYEADNKSI